MTMMMIIIMMMVKVHRVTVQGKDQMYVCIVQNDKTSRCMKVSKHNAMPNTICIEGHHAKL